LIIAVAAHTPLQLAVAAICSNFKFGLVNGRKRNRTATGCQSLSAVSSVHTSHFQLTVIATAAHTPLKLADATIVSNFKFGLANGCKRENSKASYFKFL